MFQSDTDVLEQTHPASCPFSPLSEEFAPFSDEYVDDPYKLYKVFFSVDFVKYLLFSLEEEAKWRKWIDDHFRLGPFRSDDAAQRLILAS